MLFEKKKIITALFLVAALQIPLVSHATETKFDQRINVVQKEVGQLATSFEHLQKYQNILKKLGGNSKVQIEQLTKDFESLKKEHEQLKSSAEKLNRLIYKENKSMDEYGKIGDLAEEFRIVNASVSGKEILLQSSLENAIKSIQGEIIAASQTLTASSTPLSVEEVSWLQSSWNFIGNGLGNMFDAIGWKIKPKIVTTSPSPKPTPEVYATPNIPKQVLSPFPKVLPTPVATLVPTPTLPTAVPKTEEKKTLKVLRTGKELLAVVKSKQSTREVETAIVELSTLLGKEPQDLNAQIALGKGQHVLHMYREAITSYWTAMKLVDTTKIPPSMKVMWQETISKFIVYVAEDFLKSDELKEELKVLQTQSMYLKWKNAFYNKYFLDQVIKDFDTKLVDRVIEILSATEEGRAQMKTLRFHRIEKPHEVDKSKYTL